MADYSFVRSDNTVCGLWFRDVAGMDQDIVEALLVKYDLPLPRSMRRVPNRYDNAGGCFVMFDSARAPGESEASTGEPLGRRTEELMLTIGNRNYETVDTTQAYANLVAARKRCAIRITYGAVGESHVAALKACRNERDYNFEKHIRVNCEKCQGSLNTNGIGLLIMSRHLLGVSTIDRGQVQLDRCPHCRHTYCYLVFDPEGFAP